MASTEWTLEGTQAPECCLCALQAGSIGRGWERKVDDSIDVHAFHLENDTLDGDAENLRLCKIIKVIFEEGRRIEAIAMAWACPPGATCALGGRSLGYP